MPYEDLDEKQCILEGSTKLSTCFSLKNSTY